MIVPRQRLVLWALAAPLLASVAALAPGTLAICLAAGLALLGVALADAALSLGRLDGVRASLPTLVRLVHGREGTVPVTLEAAGERPVTVRLGLPFPDSFATETDAIETTLPAGKAATAAAACTPRRRGSYVIDRVYLERASRLGLWSVRAVRPTTCEVRVYPNLRRDRRLLAALFLNRGSYGIHAQRQVGKGREFEQLRGYIPGDGLEDIHWKATAKRGHPISKVYQIERTQEVYVILDASRLSARAPGDVTRESEAEGDAPARTQAERFIQATLALALAAEQQNDHFGLAVFSDRVHRFLPARGGATHFGACREALYTLEPHLVNPNFDDLATFLRLRIRRRALLVFLTNLDDPVMAEGFARAVRLLGRHHLLLVNMLTPPGVRPLFTGPPLEHANELYGRLAAHLQWRDLRELDRSLHRLGATFSLLDNEQMSVQLVSQYINVKQRQAL